MYDVALKVLKELNDNGYKAYIVGGYVRDVLLDIESNDIDITTNATPKQIMELFNDSCLPNEDYGSVIIEKKGYYLIFLSCIVYFDEILCQINLKFQVG